MPAAPAPAGDRLAKVMARSGLCSRRDAEGWIRDGRVAVNGTVIRTPAFTVTPRDKIEVDGAPLAAREATRVWLYHKPAGLVVTEKDPEGRPTIFAALAEKGLPRVMTIGRLDINTEGLLLLTNDGGLKRVLELPATGWLRRYRVRAHGSVTQPVLDGLKAGMEVEGIKYGPIEATLERQQGSNVWLLVGLREGKNREVKNVLGALGLEVNRLIRVSFGPFQLGDLPVGEVEAVKSRVLRDQLGERLATAAGADFESAPAVARPVRARPETAERPPRGQARRDKGGDRAAPARSSEPVRARKILFDDGREAAFDKAPPPEREDRPARGADRPGRRATRPTRGEAAGRPPRSEDKPPRSTRSPSRGDKPFRRSRTAEGEMQNTPAPRREGPPRTRAPRGDTPDAHGPRRGPPRERGPQGRGGSGPRPPRPGGPRPGRPRPR